MNRKSLFFFPDPILQQLYSCLNRTRYMRTYLLATLIFFLGTADGYAQNRSISDDWKSNLNQSIWLDRIGERDSSFLLLNKTLAAAEKSGDAGRIASVKMALIRHFANYTERDSLAKYLDPLLAFSAKHNLVSTQVEALANKAGYLVEIERYREALEYCEQAIRLAKPLNDQQLNGLCLFWKGFVLRVSHNDTNAPLPYFHQALEVLQAAGDTALAIRTALMIASGEPDETKKKEMVHLAEVLSAVYPSLTAKVRILNFKSALVEADAAIPLLRQALAISRKMKTPVTSQHLLIQLSHRFLVLQRYKEALAAVDSARATAPGTLPDDAALNYYAIYRDMGDYAKAVAYMEKYMKYEDERKKTDLKSLVTEWETRMNTREKEWEIAQNQKELQSQKTRNWLLFMILTLAFIAGGIAVFAFFRQRHARRQLAIQNETILKQSEELQSLERLKSRFFANVSHELRTPLTLMLGPVSSLLKNADQRPEKDLQLLQLVQRNGNHLLKLVNEILDLSKLEVGRLELRETPVNLHDYLQPTLAQFSSFSDSGKTRLKIEYHPDPALNIYLDPDKFEKIIHNFLSNAIKFTPPEGTISLIAKDKGDNLLIKVQDSGAGIHPDDMLHIFDRFYQSKRPDAPTQGGTGIGLSLCKELAELMNGKVWAESEWGKGSTFYFQFPKKLAASEIAADPLPDGVVSKKTSPVPKPPPVKTGAPDSGVEKPLLLLVEDNADLRLYMQTLLEDTYRVRLAENGKTGWEALHTDAPPDLIISDLMMPVMDGFQLLEKIKDADAFRHIPVIMLTARADVRVKLRALRIGVDDYLTKPFVQEELVARIANLLHNYRERMQYFSGTGTPGPEKPVMASVDNEWLKVVETLISKNLTDKQFNLEWVAMQLNISVRQFNRRLQQLTGMTPKAYLQEIRLELARVLLFEGQYATVKETAFAVGFRDTPYFSELFQKRFGVLPSTYLRQGTP